MMNLYRPSNRGRSGGRKKIVAASLIVGIVFLIDVFSGGFIRHEVRTVALIGLQAVSRVTSAIGESGFFSSRRSLEGTITSQQEQLARLQEQAAAYNVLKQENESLRTLVHLAATTPGLTAPIISSLRASPYGTFIVGAGASDGVAKGNLVVTAGGFVVGRISEIDEHSAIATQLFSSGSSIDALISGAAVVVEGSGGGNARTKIAHGVRVETGSPVTAPTLGGRPIGIVGKVASSSASAYSDVYIGLPVNFNALQFVYIEK